MQLARRAFTLIEILVSLAVFGLLTGVIVTVFGVTHRYTRLYQQVSLAQREAVLCMREINRELGRGSAQTLTSPSAGVNATWFLSNQPLENSTKVAEFTDMGVVKWHKWVGVWCQSSGDVRRAEIELQGGPQPFSTVNLSGCPTLLSDFQTLPRSRRLASYITRFQVTADSKVVSVEVRAEAQVPGRPPTRYHLSSSILAQ